MRTDIENLKNGSTVWLYPNANNPIHKKPIRATYASGYFYCDESKPEEGPDYYLGDVLKFNTGFEPA